LEDHPRARSSDLTVEAIGEELLVFDAARNRAHSLNATAARVWRACDGKRNVAQLAAVCDLDAETVELALERLDGCRLLENSRPRLNGEAPRVNRRAVLRKAALTGAGLGVALPVIRSITAPTAAHAQSISCLLAPCPGGTGCCSSYFCGSLALCSSFPCGTAGDTCSVGDNSCCFGTTCVYDVTAMSSSCQGP
jgi:hypothetical protein